MAQLSETQMHDRTSPDEGPVDAAEHKESAARVLLLLEALPTNQREVIRLRFQNGFSYKEISRISGHSVTNVGYLLHAGLKTIRHRIAAGRPTEATS